MNRIVGAIEDWLWNPRFRTAALPLRNAIRVLRFAYAVIRDTLESQLTLRAMSLVYTTLLSLVPLLALSFSVLKGFGVHRQIEPLLDRFLVPLGPRGVELSEDIIGFVDNVRVDVLGAVGLGFLIYTVVSLVQKVEESFNYVWQVEQPRSFARRFSEYLSVILIGPVLMFVALGLIASVASNELVQRLHDIEPFGSGLVAAGALAPYVLVVLTFSFVYAFVPNTRVRVSAALAGGLVAGVLWAATGSLFASFVASSTRYLVIYSGFAIVIMALIWLYLSWLVLLMGAQISFYFQHPHLLRTGHREVLLDNSARERIALLTMVLVGQDFLHTGAAWRPTALATRMGIPGQTLSIVLRGLRRDGLLIETEADELIPGRAIESIMLGDIIAAVRGDGEPRRGTRLRSVPKVDDLLARIERSIEETVEGHSLRELLHATSESKDEARDAEMMSPDPDLKS